MPSKYTGKMDTNSISKTAKAAHGGHEGNAREFGMSGGKSTKDGIPMDGTAASACSKPKDYAEVGTSAKKFT